MLLPCPAKHHCRLPDLSGKESGFLLGAAGVIVLIIVAMLSSFAFVVKSEGKYQGNYAVGEQLASLANAAHIYAQQQRYDPTGLGLAIENRDIYASGMNVADFFFAPVRETVFSLEIVAKTDTPVAGTMPAAFKAASAYLHLRIRTNNGQPRLPNDTLAFQAGAIHGGLKRVGFYKTNIPTGDTCNGAATAVRWGPEDSSCLNDAQADRLIGGMFTDLQPGDVIIPAWETSLGRMDQKALLRYPQPGGPNYNSMAAPLNMGNNNIVAADVLMVTAIDPAFPSTLGNLNVTGNVSTNGTVNLQGPANISGGLNVTHPDGMNVSGKVTFNRDVIIARDLTNGGSGAQLKATLQGGQTLYISDMRLKKTPTGSAVIAGRNGASADVDTTRLNDDITLIQTTGPSSRLAVAGILDASTSVMRPVNGRMDFYTPRLVTSGSGSVQTTSPAGWTMQTLENKGGVLNIGTISSPNCYGPGCPNNIDLPPDDGPFGN